MAAQDASRELLSVFGYRSSRVVNKFAGLPVQRDAFGYHYSGETIPEGYLCPLCRCPGGKFEKKTG